MPKAERMPFTEAEARDENKELVKLIDWLHDAENSTPETLYRTAAMEDYQFYAGDQDTAEVVALLTDQKRPITVYNEVKPKVDMLIGLAAQSRYEPTVFPVGQEDEVIAEIMNGALKHFAKKIKFTRAETECFEHTVKSGRSLLYFWIDRSNPFLPKIKCKRIPGFSYWLDPDSTEYDMSDARYLFIDKWLTEDEIKMFWPKVDLSAVKGHHEKTADSPVFFNEAKDKYRIVEAWYRKWVRMKWFVNPLTGQAEGLEPAEFTKFSKALENGIPNPQNPEEKIHPEIERTFETTVEQIHYRLFSGYIDLEGGKSPYRGFLQESFPAVQFGAYKDDDNNRWMSVIEAMKDPQRAVNTMRRQLSHLLQTLPKGLLIHETGAILNVEEYEEKSSDPTYHMEVARGMVEKVKFEKQPTISPIYQQFDAIATQGMKSSSGIQDEMMGVQTTSREPGVTVRMRQEQGMAVLYLLFNNFRDSRIEASKKLMSLIQQYVTTPQLIRIEGQEGAQMLEINTQLNPQVKGFNDLSVGEFDLEMDETLENATMRMAIAQILTDFSHNNPESIPPDIVLEYSSVPYTAKMRIKKFWEEQRELQQKNIEADREIEMMKAQAAIMKAKQRPSQSKGD
jgi:hypothetical protein